MEKLQKGDKMKYFGFIFNEKYKKLLTVVYNAENNPYCILKFVKYLIKNENTTNLTVWLFPLKFIKKFKNIKEIIESNMCNFDYAGDIDHKIYKHVRHNKLFI